MLYGAKNGELQIGDRILYYVTFGRGTRPLVMIPGLGDGLHTVKGLALSFAWMYRRYANEYRVFLLSRPEPVREGETTADMAETAAETLPALSNGGFAAKYTAAGQRLVTDVSFKLGDGLMGITDYIDDEKPLYVATDDSLRITGFLDSCDNPRYISGGIYGLTPRSIATLNRCIERGESRMRNFQRALVSDGLRLQAWPFSKVLDIDHASDIQKAEAFLKIED